MKYIKFIKYFFIIIIVSLVSVEILLRISGYIYNNNRENVFETKTKGQSKTIMCIGDSHTYGGNVKWNEAYPYFLWKRISKTKDIKIINAGICEYNSNQVLYELNKNIRIYNPDYAIILVGASDKWNLINPLKSTDIGINETDYETKQNTFFERLDNNTKSLIKNLRIYKLIKIFYTNHKAKQIVKEFKKGIKDIQLDDTMLDSITSNIYPEMMSQRKYRDIIDVSFKILENIKPDSFFNSNSLSLYFSIALAYQVQSEYSADDIYKRFVELSLKNQNITRSDGFTKYLNYFKNMKKFEEDIYKNLESNLNKIILILKDNNIKTVMLTYPADYKKVNEIIRRVAKKNGVMLIDLNLEFKKSKEDINTYFDYDEHPNIKGYNKISEIIYSKIIDDVI